MSGARGFGRPAGDVSPRDGVGRDGMGRDGNAREVGRDPSRRPQPRALLPLLDRLIDDNPSDAQDPPMSSAEALEALRRSVRRDLEALLNARRRWRSWPSSLRELQASPVGFGIPDLSSGALADPKRREEFRAEVEATIRRFEPRLQRVQVTLIGESNPLDATLRLRIDGLLHADPAPEPVAFDTVVEPGISEVKVEASRDV
jgi:type VI secretion system protein ImpF